MCCTGAVGEEMASVQVNERIRDVLLWRRCFSKGCFNFPDRRDSYIQTSYEERGILLTHCSERGQGLNHGIADASKLTKCLKAAVAGETTWQAAIDEYQAEMIDRAGDEVRTSLENTYMLHDWSKMQDSPIMQRGGNPREKQESRQGGSD